MDKYSDEMDYANSALFTVLAGCGAILCAMMFIVSLFAPGYRELQWWYLTFFVLVVFVIMAERTGKLRNGKIAYYFFYGLFALYSCLTSAFITPDYVCVTILVCLFEIPILIFDKSSHVLVYTSVLAALYLSVVLPCKVEHLRPDEIINVLSFLLIGNATGLFFRTVRLEGLNLRHHLEQERSMDALTGLCNRRKLFEYLAAQEADTAGAPPSAFAMMDIDHFKKVNDTYGHAMGDTCLRKLGACLNEFGRQHNITFYRYGGEEFLGVMTMPPEGDLQTLFETLNAAVSALAVDPPQLDAGALTISIGAVPVDPAESALRYEALIDAADRAMYTAKNDGRNRTVVEVPTAVTGCPASTH